MLFHHTMIPCHKSPIVLLPYILLTHNDLPEGKQVDLVHSMCHVMTSWKDL